MVQQGVGSQRVLGRGGGRVLEGVWHVFGTLCVQSQPPLRRGMVKCQCSMIRYSVVSVVTTKTRTRMKLVFRCPGQLRLTDRRDDHHASESDVVP